MAVGKVSLRMDYTDDLGTTFPIKSSFGLPDTIADATNQQLTAIVNAAGGTVKSIKGITINNITDDPCPETGNITPRKLIIIFPSGLSLGVPFNKGDNIVSRANAIIAAARTAAGNTAPICVKLQGEKYRDILDRLGGEFTGEGVEEETSSRKFTGVITYQRDISGQSIPLPFQMNTDAINQAPSLFRSTINDCLGDLQTASFSCGSRNRQINSRRWKISYIRSLGDAGQTPVTREIPTASRTPSQIKDCGTKLVGAQTKAVFCAGYEGESDARFHLRNGINLRQ